MVFEVAPGDLHDGHRLLRVVLCVDVERAGHAVEALGLLDGVAQPDQPVAIGQSLQPVAPEHVIQNESQFTKRVFRGEEDSALTVWQEKAGGTLHSFEFQMHDYFCHVDGKSGVLEAYQREDSGSHKGKLSHPVFDISGSLHAEIRQLFRWILPNLSTQVPEDIRAFLQKFAS